MKCQYRFKLYGKVMLSQNTPIRVRDCLYEFVSGPSGLLTHIKVTRDLPKSEWPQFLRSSEPGISYELKLNDRMLSFVQLEMRSLEAALSLFSLDSIDVDYPEIAWIPESDAEKQADHVTSYSMTADNDFPACPLAFDIMARAVIAAIDLLQIELPLSFFRHGRVAYGERKYIEAIYQFYFCLRHFLETAKRGKRQ